MPARSSRSPECIPCGRAAQPPEVIRRLQPRFPVKGPSDLSAKHAEAAGWIEEILSGGVSQDH